MAEWIKILETGGLQEGTLVRAEAGGRELCLGIVEGKPFAVDDVCPHEEYPLHDGKITEDGCLRCKYHGAKFDPFSGAVKAMPAVYPLNAHPTELRPDGVYVFM